MMAAITAIVSPVDLLSLNGQYTHPAYKTAPQMMPPKSQERDLANVIGFPAFPVRNLARCLPGTLPHLEQ